MARNIIAVLVMSTLFLMLSSCSSGPNMKEGKWEITTEMGMKGIPIKMPAMTYTQCMTKDNLVPKDKDQSQKNCSTVEQKTDGDTVSWKLVCKNENTEVTTEGLITYSGVLFSGKIDVSLSGGPMTMSASNTITGKYLGPCE